MRFAILGTTRAWRPDGTEVPLGGRARRALLALLLLRPGAAVSPGRIIDILYGEQPPKNAPHALQSQVSRLRGDGIMVERVAAGYLLRVEPGDVDAHRFLRLADEGRQALDTDPGGRLIAVYSARENTEAKVVLWFGSPVLDYDRHDVEAQRRLLAEAYAGVGWEAPRLMERMRHADDLYFDAVSQVHLDRWSRGRVVLLGDAAWCPSPLSGMGTGLAMVGAYVLAGELAAAGDDHGVAFARYEQILRDYATGCQKSGQGVSKMMVPESRLALWVMSQSMKLMPYMPWKNAMANSARKTAGAVTLSDYGVSRPGGPAPRRRPWGRAS
jgi:2-polyprenyl-6-methoxyphenol hydroxylase-like FAD-dependent oxidoreductase